ncbi:hypothetical protein [Micromonospora sp. NPDC005710]|uniref:hypothetical protein n=1 Tax=Micromonospora sp. NPDC005710 TaxID=3157051 RepID=UPI0033E40BCA
MIDGVEVPALAILQLLSRHSRHSGHLGNRKCKIGAGGEVVGLARRVPTTRQE